VLVARVRENMVGFAVMRYGDDDAHLDLLAVAPSYRRLGVGRRLLEWLEKCAVVAGIASVALEVRAGNQGAQLFYERLGYRTLTRLPGYYQGIEDALRMERILSCRSGSQNSVDALLNLAKLLGPDFYHQTLSLARSGHTPASLP
jgi:ribosomal-protein-alanine N-acetyltransferase